MAISPDEMASEVEEEFVAVEEEEIDTEAILSTLRESALVFKSVANLLHYVSDPTLFRAVSQKERKIMQRLLDKVIVTSQTIDTQLYELQEQE